MLAFVHHHFHKSAYNRTGLLSGLFLKRAGEVTPDDKLIAPWRAIPKSHTIALATFYLNDHYALSGRSGSEIETPTDDVSHVLNILQLAPRAQFFEDPLHKILARPLRARSCNACQRGDS